MLNLHTYWLPTVPFSLIDAVNRVSLATGDISNAMVGGSADYNGHHVTVDFNSFRQYWIAQYFWAGRCVLARGECQSALAAGKREHERGAKGATVVAFGLDDKQADAAGALGYLPWTKEIETWHLNTFRDERFAMVNAALQMQRQFGCPAVAYLTSSATVAEYNDKVSAFIAERRQSVTAKMPPVLVEKR